jgi:hypothetical protein
MMFTCPPTPCIYTHSARSSVVTDDFLRVKGSDGSMFAFGDASTIDQPRALQRADELFAQADKDKARLLSVCGQYDVHAGVIPLGWGCFVAVLV